MVSSPSDEDQPRPRSGTGSPLSTSIDSTSAQRLRPPGSDNGSPRTMMPLSRGTPVAPSPGVTPLMV
jgi:hypothetical protein